MNEKEYNAIGGDGNVVENQNLKSFDAAYTAVVKECMSSNGNVNSHQYPARVMIRCLNSDQEFEVVGVDSSIMMGCGCWDGVIIDIIAK